MRIFRRISCVTGSAPVATDDRKDIWFTAGTEKLLGLMGAYQNETTPFCLISYLELGVFDVLAKCRRA